MMPAAKHGDMQMGVDIHLCMVPMPAPTPTPLPTPHMSVVFDPFDYVPVIGATITVCGMKRATAGTAGKVVHIPPGFPFAPKMPDTEDELFMGSSTVVADGDPMSHIAHPVLSCQAAGMMSPFRLKKKGGPRAMVLPTVFNLATPTTVFVGGPPTISLMGMAMKGVFAGLGKLAKSGVFKRMRQKLFKNMKPGFLKCTILRAEPVNILSGAVSVEQQDFSLPGRLPVEWLRSYSSSNSHVGVCGPGWETLLDIRLEVDAADGSVMLHGPGVGPLSFERLPAAAGDAAMVLELSDGARLTDHGDEWQVRTKEDRIYCFPKSMAMRTATGNGHAPIGRIADRCGNALTLEYRGREPHALVEAAGRRLALTMAGGRLAAVTLVDGVTHAEHGFVRYEYDAAGDLVAVIDALGASYRFAYGSGVTAHHMVRHTDRNGLSFHYSYETAPEGTQRVVHGWGDGGLYDYRFDYIDALNERRITDSLGHVSLVKLDDRGLPINEIDPLGGMTVYEYDEAGRTTAVVDPAGRRTGYEYDGRGNLLKLVRPDGTSTRSVFDGNDQPVSVVEPNGATWTYRWDECGRLSEHLSPLGHASRYEYDAQGQLCAFVNPRGARTTLRFDVLGQLHEMADAVGGHVVLRHDAIGNVVEKLVSPGQPGALYRYDAKGRLTAARQPSGSIVRFGYDAEDNLTHYTDENGHVTQMAYFGQGEVARRTYADGSSVEYSYDTEERLVGVRNPRGELHEFRRDALGRLVEEIDYWGQRRRYEYDRSGFLVATEDPLRRRMEYVCDPLGRIVQKTMPHPMGESHPWVETLAYDAAGEIVEAVNPLVRLLREFDAEGRLLKELQLHADGAHFAVENVHDACGNRVRRTTAGGMTASHAVEFSYDLIDQPAAVRIDGGETIRLERDELGRLVREELAPGLVRHSQYDPEGRIVGRSVEAGGQALFTAQYRYDPAGRLCGQQDSEWGAHRYVHDPIGRIVEHLDPQGLLQRWIRDPAGDLLVTSPADAPGRETGSSEMDAWYREGAWAGIRYRFDRAGNLTRKAFEGAHLDLAWDANQRLVASRRFYDDGKLPASASITTYGYDPLGRRLFKRTAGDVTRFGWDGDAMACEAGLLAHAEYVHLPELDEPLAVLVDGQRPAFFDNEPNGCPSRIVDERGEVIWRGTHSILGRLTSGGPQNRIRLQGQYADPETGLHYNRHRYYDPDAGLFVSADPLGLEPGDNPYEYAPNVFDFTDPLGLKCKGAKRGPKPKGKGPHNKTIDKRIAELKKSLGAEWEHTAGGKSKKEDFIRTPGGHKDARRPDITFTNKKTGEKYYENVGKKDASGRPITRERKAIEDIQGETGVPVAFTPYN